MKTLCLTCIDLSFIWNYERCLPYANPWLLYWLSETRQPYKIWFPASVKGWQITNSQFYLTFLLWTIKWLFRFIPIPLAWLLQDFVLRLQGTQDDSPQFVLMRDLPNLQVQSRMGSCSDIHHLRFRLTGYQTFC